MRAGQRSSERPAISLKMDCTKEAIQTTACRAAMD